MLFNLNELIGGEVLKYLYVCRSNLNIWFLHHFPAVGSKLAYEVMVNIFTDWVTAPIRLPVLLTTAPKHLPVLVPLQVVLHDTIVKLSVLVFKLSISKNAGLQEIIAEISPLAKVVIHVRQRRPESL